MELVLSDEQEEFRQTTHKFLGAQSPISATRALVSSADGFDREMWRRGAELGWVSMLVPEAMGGGSLSEFGLADLVLVAEEMGRFVAPGPLVPTNIVAFALGRSPAAGEHAELLNAILAGTAVAAWAHAERGRGWGDVGATATTDDDQLVINGSKQPVEAGAQASHVLLSARSGDGLVQVIVPTDAPGLTVTPMGGLDLVRRFARIDCNNVRVPMSAVVSTADRAHDDVELQMLVAAVVQCAETVGVVSRVFEMTLEYVADRYSFGRPLASYQALKHRFADMKIWLEACCATATAATRAVAAGEPDAAELVSAAKAYIGPRATQIIQDCVQMHGGIGVTWEHDIHLYLRRATVNRAMYGTSSEHAERIARIAFGAPA